MGLDAWFGRLKTKFETTRSDATRDSKVADVAQQKQSLTEGMIPVISSMVAAIKFVPTGKGVGIIVIKYRWGFIAGYPDQSEDKYDDLFSANSKGRFVRQYLWDQPYDAL